MLRTSAKITQAFSSNAYQATHYTALALAMGVEAVAVTGAAATGVTVSGVTLATAAQMGAITGVATQMIPGVALAMGFCGLALGISDIVASYVFKAEHIDPYFLHACDPSHHKQDSRLDDEESKSSHPSQGEPEKLKHKNLRWHGTYTALASLPVTGLSLAAFTPGLMPVALLGMALTSGIHFLAALNTLAKTSSPSGMQIISPVFTGMETAGWVLCALGNPALGFAFLGAASLCQLAWKGTLIKDTLANVSASGNALFNACRQKGDVDLLAPEPKYAMYSYKPAL